MIPATVPVVRETVPPSSVTSWQKLVSDVPNIDIPLKVVPVTIESIFEVIVAVSALSDAILGSRKQMCYYCRELLIPLVSEQESNFI